MNTDERIALRDFTGIEARIAAYHGLTPEECVDFETLYASARYAATRTYAPSYFEWAATRGRNHART